LRNDTLHSSLFILYTPNGKPQIESTFSKDVHDQLDRVFKPIMCSEEQECRIDLDPGAGCSAIFHTSITITTASKLGTKSRPV